MMMDLVGRKRMLALIDRCVFQGMTSFQLEKELRANFGSTAQSDAIVRAAYDSLWLIYDDLEDCPVQITREQWRCLQGIRLLLLSDCQGEFVGRFSLLQIAHVGSLVVATCLIVHYGLFLGSLIALPLVGCLNRFLDWGPVRDKVIPRRRKPFLSAVEMLKLARKVGFRKPPYRNPYSGRECTGQHDMRMLVRVFLRCVLPVEVVLKAVSIHRELVLAVDKTESATK
jgi:hypothetical protein